MDSINTCAGGLNRSSVLKELNLNARSPMNTKYSLSKASRKVRKGRATLRKMMDNGDLSFELNGDGHRILEASELQRVFPDRFQLDDDEESPKSKAQSKSSGKRTEPDSDLVFLLDELKKSTQREREQAEAHIARIEKDFDDAKASFRNSLSLIEDLTSRAEDFKAEKIAMEERHAKELAKAAKEAATEAVKTWQEEERRRRQELAARRQEELEAKRSRSFFRRLMG